jgi:hypothetical protein
MHVPDDAQIREVERLKAAIIEALNEVGFVLPGSLVRREVRCGRADCRCHEEPPRLHGPYWSWTRKVRAKTVTRLLSDEQLETYRPWLDNARRIKALLRELESISMAIVDSETVPK